MHEHIDEIGIINMNGRIYDPLIGRFMSADPYIQAPDDLQSHNRYAYVMNNPLNLTDPSGFSWLSKTWKKVWKSPIFKAMVGIVVAIYAPALLQTFFGLTAGGLGSAIATGALSGFASTGTLKGALTGAFTAGIMFGVGEIGQALKLESGGIGKVALHAGAGCISSVAGGGSCQTGAMSGALGQLASNLPNGGREFNTVKAAMLGGIGSRLSGGKFADGAITGAFGYLFNDSAHQEKLRNINPLPGGAGGPSITFINDDPRGASTDLPVSPRVADIVEKTVVDCGCSVNINSSTGGHAGTPSLHNGGNAIDINFVDGLNVKLSPDAIPIVKFTNYLGINAETMGGREMFSPSGVYKIDRNGGVDYMFKGHEKIQASHRNHIHISVPRQ